MTLHTRLDRLDSARQDNIQPLHIVVAFANPGDVPWSGPSDEDAAIVEAAMRREGLSPIAVW